MFHLWSLGAWANSDDLPHIMAAYGCFQSISEARWSAGVPNTSHTWTTEWHSHTAAQACSENTAPPVLVWMHPKCVNNGCRVTFTTRRGRHKFCTAVLNKNSDTTALKCWMRSTTSKFYLHTCTDVFSAKCASGIKSESPFIIIQSSDKIWHTRPKSTTWDRSGFQKRKSLLT